MTPTALRLAPRLPLVEHGRRATRELHDATGLTAYLAIPSYGDVLVIARAGDRAPRLWALVPAVEDASGHVLLAHNDAWRHSQGARRTTSAEQDVALIRERGYTSTTTEGARTGSLAAAVPAQHGPPIAALAIRGPKDDLISDETGLMELLDDAAAKLARRVYDARRTAPQIRERRFATGLSNQARKFSHIRGDTLASPESGREVGAAQHDRVSSGASV